MPAWSARPLTARLTARLTGRLTAPNEGILRTIPAGTGPSPYPVRVMDTCDLPTTPHTPGPTWRATWHAGPDAGSCCLLGPGQHLLGRATAAPVRADDPALQPHHALLHVHADGTLTITQLAGRQPMRLNGAPLAMAAVVAADAWLEVGDSLLQLQRNPHLAVAAPAHTNGGTLVRAARAVPQWQPITRHEPTAPPADDERVGGLIPALVGLVGAGVLATVMRQPTFLVFGALGAVVTAATWGSQRVALRRRRRRAKATYADECRAAQAEHDRTRQAFHRHHTVLVPTVVTAMATATARTHELWARGPAHGDAWLAALGLGDVRLPGAPGELVVGVAVPADLGPGCRLALSGRQAPAVARALLTQLTVSCGPADVRVVIVTDQAQRWTHLSDLPHLALPDGSAAITDEAGLAAVLAELEGHPANIVVVTDEPGAIATRTSPLRRLLADPAQHALLVLLPAGATVPHLCTSALLTAVGPAAAWLADTRSACPPIAVRIAGMGEQATFRCAAAQRGLVDPEDPLSVATGMPRALALRDVYDGALPDSAAIVRAWAAAGCDPAPRALVGRATDGVVDIDLVRDGPHGLIAGTTGAGKSELLRTLVVGMAANASPAHLNLVLVDYKGGATFDACAALPHVVGTVTDLDDRLADRALRSLHAELRRREALLRDHGAPDLTALRATAPHVMLPRLVVVVDEFAALVAEHPTFLHALVGIAQRGRSLGVHLLLATQRPNGVVSDDVRANTNLRVALRLHDVADALDVVGVDTPAHLPRRVPGRAVLRLGADEHLTFQTAQCTAPEGTMPSPLRTLVRTIADAARTAGITPPAAPWQPPLPTQLSAADTPVGALGLIDDPDRQRVLPLRWTPSDGSLLVAGSTDSGVTSTLRSLAAHVLATTPDHVYVLDAHGSAAFDALATHPRCGAVVRLHEGERLGRLLRRVRSTEPTANTVVFIDGLDIVRRVLDDIDTADEYDAFTTLLAGDDTRGITVVAGVQHTAAVPAAFLARCPHRWVLHLHDPHDATTLGVAANLVPPACAGRIVIAGDGLTAQLVHPDAMAALPHESGAAHSAAPRIEIVPATIEAATLAPGRHHEGTTALAVGTGFGTGATHLLRVHDGEHLLVVGAARTGRTTAIVRLATAWAALHPGGWIGALPSRRHTCWPAHVPLTDVDTACALESGRPALLVVDDAEYVDDPGGRLAALAEAGHVCIIAAGRPDALRQAYGHWTGVVRRSRLGLVAAGGGELDGDLLGVVLPRRMPIAPRPGLVWAVDGGRAELVQVATDEAHPGATRLATR
ncbi:MAG: FtsK/SpoIIIE domain-containing protein [Actinomycetota bacterium]|nr:FtsK/SpoIIIE domain-containing protein [Actinomycetota bacterium]